MKITALVVTGVLVFMSLPQNSFTEEPSWNLQVDLVDGSRIIGVPAKKSLDVDVKFGELEIPLERIRHADWSDNGQTVRIELVNEDVFTGTLQPGPFEIETIFGAVTVHMKHFKTLEVKPTNLLGWLPTTRGLVLYYAFDDVGDGVVANLAGGKHTGKLNGAIWLKDGQRGGAIQFNNSAKIEVAHENDLCSQVITLGAWVKPHGSQSGYQVIVGKTAASSWHGGYGFVRIPGNDKMIHFFINGYTDSVAKTEIPHGSWSHVVGVCDGKTVTIYLNGQAMHTVPVRGTSAPQSEGESPIDPAQQRRQSIRHTTAPLFIGSDARGYAWNGTIDELVLYNRAFSASEVQRLFEASRSPR